MAIDKGPHTLAGCPSLGKYPMERDTWIAAVSVSATYWRAAVERRDCCTAVKTPFGIGMGVLVGVAGTVGIAVEVLMDRVGELTDWLGVSINAGVGGWQADATRIREIQTRRKGLTVIGIRNNYISLKRRILDAMKIHASSTFSIG